LRWYKQRCAMAKLL